MFSKVLLSSAFCHKKKICERVVPTSKSRLEMTFTGLKDNTAKSFELAMVDGETSDDDIAIVDEINVKSNGKLLHILSLVRINILPNAACLEFSPKSSQVPSSSSHCNTVLNVLNFHFRRTKHQFCLASESIL